MDAEQLDHVLIAVPDLGSAADILYHRFGLDSVEGGRHPDWGTANRIVPVHGAYLELIAVVDSERALASAFGRWIANVPPGPLQPLGWAVRTTSVESVARRLGLQVRPGSRAAPDGRQLNWRSAGVEQAASDPALPFFIEWGVDTTHPSAVGVNHPAGAVTLRRLELLGDDARLAAWLGDHRLPVTIEPGESSVSRIVLESPTAGSIVIERHSAPTASA